MQVNRPTRPTFGSRIYSELQLQESTLLPTSSRSWVQVTKVLRLRRMMVLRRLQLKNRPRLKLTPGLSRTLKRKRLRKIRSVDTKRKKGGRSRPMRRSDSDWSTRNKSRNE